MSPQALLAVLGLKATGAPTRLSGGDMGEVYRVGELVLKTHPSPPPGLYPAEARGLARLEATGARVPSVLGVCEQGLALEFLPAGRPDWGGMGEMVARLHRAGADRYGSETPLFLGRFPLPAGQDDDWRHHWVTRRIRPLLDATRPVLGGAARVVEQVLDEVEPPTEGPGWIHGDLWSGNVHHSVDGPALIDPSAQVGERGVDLAMMSLFGGFPAAFWEAYEGVAPIPEAVRAAVPYHQLLYLLVHVHFFGGAYVAQTERVAAAALRR